MVLIFLVILSTLKVELGDVLRLKIDIIKWFIG